MDIERPRPGQQTGQQTGMTMVETMVAMAISSVLVLGAISMYSNARANYRTAENIARLQESMRFATDTLDRDVRLAGFWGRTNEAAPIIRDAAATVACANNDVTAWALGQRGIGIDASDDTYDLDCPGTNPRANSDVLIVRHVDPTQNTVATANSIQVQTHNTGGTIFADGNPPLGAPDPNLNQIYDVAVSAYYVSNESRYDDAMPSLRRRTLVGQTMQDQEIINGVENLQVQFGIDRTGDGRADGYVDDDHPGKTDDNIVSVRLWLLVRGDTDETAQGYIDDKVYETPDADGFVITPDGGDQYPQNFRRYAFTKTIALRN
jgi:type IV pilus assembly protein PilW